MKSFYRVRLFYKKVCVCFNKVIWHPHALAVHPALYGPSIIFSVKKQVSTRERLFFHRHYYSPVKYFPFYGGAWMTGRFPQWLMLPAFPADQALLLLPGYYSANLTNFPWSMCSILILKAWYRQVNRRVGIEDEYETCRWIRLNKYNSFPTTRFPNITYKI